MNINRNRSFPYPVLGLRRGIDSVANANLTPSATDDCYVWDIIIEHDNEDIDRLVKEGSVQYVCEVDCSNTYYRRAFFVNDEENDKRIIVKVPKNEVGGRVNLAVTALAVKPISQYKNSKASGFYANYSFSVEEGDILGIFGEWDIDLDIEAKNYKRITSIIQLQLTDDAEEDVDFNDNKVIVIYVPKSKYTDYMDKVVNPYFKPALLASLVSSAFVRAFHHLKENETKTWARILELKAEELGYDDVKEELSENPDLAYELTRKILDEPSIQLYNLLIDMEFQNTNNRG